MPVPSFVTEENVYFNGELNNAAVLDNTGGIRHLILWDDLSLADQEILTAFVEANDDPVAGKAVLNYGSAVGSTPTGLGAGVAATAAYQNILYAATSGSTSTGLVNDSTTYAANVNVDGTPVAISVVGSAAQTFTALIAQIQADLGAVATIAEFSPGVLRITSATTGGSSTINASGALFSAVAGFSAISPAVDGQAGTPAPTYTATVTVDGVAKPISVSGSAAQTFTALVSEVQTDVGASATVALTGGKIVITSATTGASSSVAVTEGTLFGSVAGYAGTTVTPGAAVQLYQRFLTTRSPNGALYSEIYRVLAVGEKPVVLPNTPHSIQFVYWDGTQWLYLDDDTPVCVA